MLIVEDPYCKQYIASHDGIEFFILIDNPFSSSYSIRELEKDYYYGYYHELSNIFTDEE